MQILLVPNLSGNQRKERGRGRIAKIHAKFPLILEFIKHRYFTSNNLNIKLTGMDWL